MILGLDGVGKTTIHFKLNFRKEVNFPVIGYNITALDFNQTKYSLLDVENIERTHKVWKTF